MAVDAQVLVVGAGPTGLLLAGDLARAGVSCLLVERRARESNLTRAFAVHARTLETLDARGVADDLVAARTFPGNRPTTSIMAPALTPSVLGQLVALYEHITFVQGAVWGIDSFDQWGVELGKQLAQELRPAISGDAAVAAEQDASTQSLIRYYQEKR